MKNIFRTAAAAALIVGSATQAFAESITFDAQATILEALALVKNADLAFANIVPDAASGGTVIVSPASALTCAAVLTCSGTVSAADFTVTGTPGATYSLTLPPSANITSGTDTMLVDNFTNSLGGSAGSLVGGADTFQLGATLNVGAAQPVGTYTGTFAVTVEYQ